MTSKACSHPVGVSEVYSILILEDYRQQIGQSLSQGFNDLELVQWLKNIDNIRMQWKAGKVFYFSELKAQQHLAKMVGDMKNHRGKRRPRKQSNWVDNSKRFESTTQITPTTWTNALVSRRSSRSRRSRASSFQLQEPIGNDTTINTPNQPIVMQAPPEAPKLPELRDQDESIASGNHDHSYETRADSGHHSNASSVNYSLNYMNSPFASYFDEVDVKVGSIVPVISPIFNRTLI